MVLKLKLAMLEKREREVKLGGVKDERGLSLGAICDGRRRGYGEDVAE